MPQKPLTPSGRRLWKQALELVREPGVEESLRLVREMKRNGEDAYFVLVREGNLLDVQGHWDRARKLYAKAHRLNPEGTEALIDLGDHYREQREPPLPRRALRFYMAAQAILDRGTYDRDYDLELESTYEGIMACLFADGRAEDASEMLRAASLRWPHLAKNLKAIADEAKDST